MLILLTGPVGSGKTTLCQRLVDLARRRGLNVAGVLTPAVVENGIKVGIEAIDQRTDEVRLLARSRGLDAHSDHGVVCQGGVVGWTQVGQYLLDDLVLEWMALLCEEALAPRRATGNSLVFVDEIGRLELDRGGGLARLIPLLAAACDACVIVIVRDSLLDRLSARVQSAGPRVVAIEPRCREAAWTEITRLVFEDAASS